MRGGGLGLQPRRPRPAGEAREVLGLRLRSFQLTRRLPFGVAGLMVSRRPRAGGGASASARAAGRFAGGVGGRGGAGRAAPPSTGVSSRAGVPASSPLLFDVPLRLPLPPRGRWRPPRDWNPPEPRPAPAPAGGRRVARGRAPPRAVASSEGLRTTRPPGPASSRPPLQADLARGPARATWPRVRRTSRWSRAAFSRSRALTRPWPRRGMSSWCRATCQPPLSGSEASLIALSLASRIKTAGSGWPLRIWSSVSQVP